MDEDEHSTSAVAVLHTEGGSISNHEHGAGCMVQQSVRG